VVRSDVTDVAIAEGQPPVPPAAFVLPKPPGPRPKPVEQLPSTFASIAMLLAATAPVSSVLPMAVTHSPTTNADDVALTVLEYFVAEVVVTVMSVTVGEAELDGEALEPKARRRLSTTKVLPSTLVISPLAPNAPRLNPPAPGDRLGRGAALPLANRPAKPPAPPPKPVPPPKPPVQDPLTASLSTTVSAATVVLVDELPDELPVPVAGRATAHIPTFTSAAVAVTVFVMRVLDEYVTAVCELVFCTCSVLPVSAAISPDAPGNRPLP
jgi:hypothetical protein